MQFSWEITEGGGVLASTADQEIEFLAPGTPGLSRLKVTVTQREVICTAEALVTVTDTLEPSVGAAIINARGLPGYTFERAAGELWRSRYDTEHNVIVVNNGHRDFVFAPPIGRCSCGTSCGFTSRSSYCATSPESRPNSSSIG